MTTPSERVPSTHSFQAEAKQLLHLLSHSLYQSREIAIRELVSNASDALDKMRLIGLLDAQYRDDAPLEINIRLDHDLREIAVCDNGLGMTHDELVANLGTIAHSGSREFLQSLSNTSNDKLSLIGQFGVGFYSAFMLADSVRVLTRSYRESSGWEWWSDGDGSFSVAPADDVPRGTQVILHLKDDTKELTAPLRVKTILRRYSCFIPHTIKVGDEVVTEQKPIGVEPPGRLTEKDYTDFYHYLSHQDNETPAFYIHVSFDSPIQFHALAYCPPSNHELLGFGAFEHGLNLCVRRVLVQQDCRDLVPKYMRFLRGVVDSEDLPLNVSRESLQDNTIFQKIRSTLTRCVFDRLDAMAAQSPDAYLTFYKQFNRMLKEGLYTDFPYRDRIARLLRFPSTLTDDPEQLTSLDEYLSRCAEDQKQIYYLGGQNVATLRGSPHLEVFRKRGLEVLYAPEPPDELVLDSLGTYQEHRLVSIYSSEMVLPEVKSETPKEGESKPPETPGVEPPQGADRVLGLFKEALEDLVEDVRWSERLSESPCCLVQSDSGMSSHLRAMMRALDRQLITNRYVLEINPKATLIANLARLDSSQDEFIKECGQQLFANSQLLQGIPPDPVKMASRIHKFMDAVAAQRADG